MPVKFSAIILAAGFSSRMGKFKALLPLGDLTIIERTILLFQDAAIYDIHIVVGHGKQALLPVLKKHGVKITDNPDFEAGMFSSVRAGLSCLDQGRDACFIHPVDLPLVCPDTVRRLRECYEKTPGKIIRPCFSGRRGHPPLLPCFCFEYLLNWNGNGGLKAALSKFGKNSVFLEVPDRQILFDIDTPEDYKAALNEWGTH